MVLLEAVHEMLKLIKIGVTAMQGLTRKNTADKNIRLPSANHTWLATLLYKTSPVHISIHKEMAEHDKVYSKDN